MKPYLFALIIIALFIVIAATPAARRTFAPHRALPKHRTLALDHALASRRTPAAKLIFFDDFNTGHLDRSKWNVVVTGFHVNNELQAYVDSGKTLFEQNGQLVFQPCYTPGFVTHDGQHFDFISAR